MDHVTTNQSDTSRSFLGLSSKLAVAALLAAIVGGLLLVSGSAGGADRAIAHGSGTNGCSHVDNSGSYFNFHAACDWHDGCYINHWSSWMGCNIGFGARMTDYCIRTYQWWQWQRAACMGRANIYYYGTVAFGWPCYYRLIADCRLQ